MSAPWHDDDPSSTSSISTSQKRTSNKYKKRKRKSRTITTTTDNSLLLSMTPGNADSLPSTSNHADEPDEFAVLSRRTPLRPPKPKPYLPGAPKTFSLFSDLPPENQIAIFKFAAASRMSRMQQQTGKNPVHMSYYNTQFMSRPISIYTSTRVRINWQHARRLHFVCGFDDLLRVSRCGKIAALEEWRGRVQRYKCVRIWWRLGARRRRKWLVWWLVWWLVGCSQSRRRMRLLWYWMSSFGC